jgi:hypothetical protein
LLRPEADESLDFNLGGMGQRVLSTEVGLHPPRYLEGGIGDTCSAPNPEPDTSATVL